MKIFMKILISMVIIVPVILTSSPALTSPKNTSESLTVHDHTLIVDTILSNPWPVLKELDLREYLLENTYPSKTEILEAALRVERIDDYTKKRIAMVLEEFVKIQGVEIPEAETLAVNEIVKQLEKSNTVWEAIGILENIKASYRYADYEGLSIGIDVSIGILQSGSKSIYSPEHPFYSFCSTVRDMAKADVAGGISGAVAGAIVGAGPGAAPGAIGGAVTGSLIAGINRLIDWLF